MSLKLQLSPNNPNTRERSEEVFQRGGLWEKNQGRTQTRLFAECFHLHVRVPLGGEFTVLDVGCALGDALPVWKQYYPQAHLYGCDVAQVAVDRCSQEYGNIAEFFRASFEDLQDAWDVIYCSNVLEHFEQHVQIADALLTRCRILYVMTPYLELRLGKPLLPEPGQFHVATFYKRTFDTLKYTRQAKIASRVIRCPGAWGGNWKGETVQALKRLAKEHKYLPTRQIVYIIQNTSR